ncbi:uncharacterized protein DS421_16g543700 [Arachis hypogaea]|nr:uncharacterized protein DS421_16g543700 [Arachis hypogaea]
MLPFKCGEVAISGIYFGELLHTFSFILDIFLYFFLFFFYCYFLSTYTLLLVYFTLFSAFCIFCSHFSYLV